MGKHFVSNRDESPRMFASDGIERFTFVHPLVPHLIYLPIIAALLWWSPLSIGMTALVFVAGLFVWTFVEYMLHKYAFHAPHRVMDEVHDIVAETPIDEPIIPRLPTLHHTIYFIAHGVHHEYPSDSRRLVMPPIASIPLAAAFFGLFLLIFGTTYTPALFAGFLIGYLAYDSIHFAVHHFSVPTAFGKLLKRRHHRHHFLDPDEDYGVSSPLWDIILGTYTKVDPPKRGAKAA